MRSRRDRIKQSGLVERAVLMDEEDADIIRKYAQNLYKKRGKTLTP